MIESEQDVERCREWLTQVVDIDCRSGGYDEADTLGAVEEIIQDMLGGPHPELLGEFAAKVKEGMAAHAEAERTWQERTVNDAITSAFEALTDRGVLAIEAIGTTVQEGRALVEHLAAGLRGVRGLVFFHRQDLERGVRGEGLYLAFDALGPGLPEPRPAGESAGAVRMGPQRADRNVAGSGAEAQEAASAIGREVVAVLKHYGVEAQWDGQAHSRIAIGPFPWRKRRATVAPPGPASPPPDADLGALPPAPAPVVCPDCKGRGWLPPLQEGGFADLCWCRGGARREPAAEAPAHVEASVVEATAAPGGGLLGRIKRWFG